MRTSSVAGLGFCAGSSAENACWGRRDAPTSTVVWRVFFNFIMYLNTRTVLRKSNVFLPQGDNAPVLATRCIIIRILLALPCTQNRTLTNAYLYFSCPLFGVQIMAGAEGFEPPYAGTKNRGLTAWLRPKKIIKSNTSIIFQVRTCLLPCTSCKNQAPLPSESLCHQILPMESIVCAVARGDVPFTTSH